MDCTGIGGAIEQDLRVACVPKSIHFIAFIFTGGPRGTKTQVYRDYVSFVQQRQIRVPNPDKLEPNEAKLITRWLRQHIDLEYVMDIANKTEKISAPDTKHDDYCDSSVMAIHAALSMLPAEGTFASLSVDKKKRRDIADIGRRGPMGILRSRSRQNKIRKPRLSGI